MVRDTFSEYDMVSGISWIDLTLVSIHYSDLRELLRGIKSKYPCNMELQYPLFI